MRRVLSRLLIAVLLPATALPVPQGRAQQAGAAPNAVEFASLYRRWQEAYATEEGIALGEQILALEPTLTPWPLETPRERVKAQLGFGLGSAYLVRRRGVHADNLETGIAYLEAALAVWTREAEPQDWARAHNNIGIAYWGRIRGERADNQEKAIAHYEAALTIFSQETARQEWAQLQNNLAIAYWSRVHGERASNLETAIAHFEAALGVFARETEPLLWAQAQNNLGNAYIQRVQGERADNREKAIAHIEAALTVFTGEATPNEWGSAQTNLAIAYLDRIRGDRADNQETALAHLQAALTTVSREASPLQWAKAQRVAGDAYADRNRGERASNRGHAIAAYEAALTVFTAEAHPRDHMLTARQLARVLSEAGEFRKAGPIYASARDAFLVLFGQGLDEAEARALIAGAGPLFAEAAFAALQRGETEAALELASEGRARLLAVSMKLQMLELPAGQRQRLDELRIAIRGEQQAAESAQGTERAAAIERLIALRQELLGLVKGGQGDGRSGAALVAARDAASKGGAVVMPVLTSLGGKIVVMTNATDGKDLTVIDLPDLTPERLAVLLIGPGNGPPAGWIAAYFINYLDGDEQDKRWPEWIAAIDGLGTELWRLFAGRLDAVLKERGLEPGARLVWLPSGWLGVLPLGLAQDPASQRRLANTYEIVYAPSLEALAAARREVANAGPATLAAVINPTGDLPGAETEGAIVASHFASNARTVLERGAATPQAVLAALKGRTHWHFASHGTFSWADARQSALVMHGQSRLNVGQLQETDGLGRPRLVVLSACETGLSDITGNPDEFIGLPGTFAALGAAGVIGTLWPVSDAATALLIAKFYELHIDAGLPPPTALYRAQAWLREATNDDLTAYTKAAAARGRLSIRRFTEIERALGAEALERSRNRGLVQWMLPDAKAGDRRKVKAGTPKVLARPYAHPYFWAGFIHTGL